MLIEFSGLSGVVDEVSRQGVVSDGKQIIT